MSLNILLAEENDVTQQLVKLTFEKEDVQISISAGGDSIIESANSNKPDIILIDSNIAVINEYELCKKIKEIPDLQNIPILLLADPSEDFDNKKLESIKADGFLNKPLKANELLSTVAKLTGVIFKEEEKQGDEDTTFKENNSIIKLTDAEEIISDDLEDLTITNDIFPEDIFNENEKDVNFQNIFKENLPISYEKEKSFDDSNLELSEIINNNLNNNKQDEKNVSEVSNNLTSKDKNEFQTKEDTLSNLLGDKVKLVLENSIVDMTNKILKDVIEKNMKEGIEKTFATITPKIVKNIEDISWKIIPDLAETLIKKEIEKIKKGLR